MNDFKDSRPYSEDKGQTIADMSGISRPNMFGIRRSASLGENLGMQRGSQHGAFGAQGGQSPYGVQGKVPSPLADLSKEERRWVIGGALKASLLIALAFIVGLGAVILLITTLIK